MVSKIFKKTSRAQVEAQLTRALDGLSLALKNCSAGGRGSAVHASPTSTQFGMPM
ncbi:MAG: hypothetical protein SNF33_08240 [Candidatus Algichlamydia australiensis]|nr:hypothetical protein [Chlamydiales bacterium]